MGQSFGWEQPAYYVNNNGVAIQNYDWYGQYGHAVNSDKRYEQQVAGDCSFDLSKHHDLVSGCTVLMIIYNLRLQ